MFYRAFAATFIILCLSLSALAQNIIGGGVFGGDKAGVSYVGPGDITSDGYIAWWGLSAYSSGTRGNVVVNVCDSTGGVDVACADMVTSSTTGLLVSKAIGGVTCPGNANCTVKKLYDQSGANACTAAPCDVSKSAVANRPVLNSALGTGTCMLFTSAGSQTLNTTANLASTYAQPWSMYFVGQATGATTATSVVIAHGANSRYAGYFNTATNTAVFNAGTKVGLAASFAAAHTIAFTANGASSVGSVDGTNTTLNAGTNTLLSGSPLALNTSSGSFGNSVFCEGGIWNSDKSSNFSTLSTNRKTLWGY